jgi:hypothetical protein
VKKLGIIGLFLIYAAASIGISIKQFYCCNQLKSTSLAYTAVEESSCGMSHKMKDCCKTKVTFLKSQDTHFAKTGSISMPSLEMHINTTAFFSIAPIIHYKGTIAVPQSNPPPLQDGIPLYQFYCNYRI